VSGAFTMDKLNAVVRLVRSVPRFPTISVTPSALVETEERLFPVSRHRSRRIHKKLVKRHGGVFRMKPGAFQVGDQIFMHPVLYEDLKRHEAVKLRENSDRAFMRGFTGNPW
jgi:hypothetical protein